MTVVAKMRRAGPGAAGILCCICLLVPLLDGAAPAMAAAPAASTGSARKPDNGPTAVPRSLPEIPLYPGAVPNAIAHPVQELAASVSGGRLGSKAPRPTLQVWLPAASRNSQTAVLLFPGGAYIFLSRDWEGERIARELADRGITAVIVNYRMPSDANLKDKSIGPLQDAQQALRVVRQHAAEWGFRPDRVGVMGFSVGGHVAALASTQFQQALVPNPDNVSLRPDFSVLVYPLISMQPSLTHMESRTNLLGKQPTEAQVRRFSADLQVSDKTPPTLLLSATDDNVVDVGNTLAYYEALRRHRVPAGLVLLPDGGHGFFLTARNRWLDPLWDWLQHYGWLKP